MPINKMFAQVADHLVARGLAQRRPCARPALARGARAGRCGARHNGPAAGPPGPLHEAA
jgi:hypothetical protein